jgi:hypothetical protein
MRKLNRVYGMGILVMAVSMFLMTGCCARLQSPIVFDNYCGWNTCGSPCGGCGPSGPAPCDPSYR